MRALHPSWASGTTVKSNLTRGPSTHHLRQEECCPVESAVKLARLDIYPAMYLCHVTWTASARFLEVSHHRPLRALQPVYRTSPYRSQLDDQSY
eukprot:5488119-Prymnesium_polylepis.1